MTVSSSAGRLKFGVIGPFQVVYDGDQNAFPRGTLRTLLVTLILHRGKVVSPAELIDAIWRENLPGHPTAALSTALTRVRKRLNEITTGAPDPIVGVSGGYMLSETAYTDTEALHERLHQTAAATALGDLAAAETAATEGLRLWRGPILPEVDSPQLRYGPIAWLEERLLECLERRVVLAILRGHESEVIGDLRVQVLKHPARERLWYYLALSLHRGGRSVEALEVLRRAEAYLRTEIGVDPGDSLRKLQTGILRQDSSLTCPPGETPGWLPGCAWIPHGSQVVVAV